MNSADELQRKEETTRQRALEFRRTLEEYIAELRAIINKLRRKLN